MQQLFSSFKKIFFIFKDKAFFTPSADVLFENFFSSFDRITIDRRCHHYITTARELIKKPYVDLIEVFILYFLCFLVFGSELG